MNSYKVAEVIPLKMNLNHGFHYLIPPSLKEMAEVGKRVTVPFRNNKKIGIITNIFEETELKNLKEIEDVLDPVPILSGKVLALIDWMSRYYFCPKGLVISSIIPYRISSKKIASILEDHSFNNRPFSKEDDKCNAININNYQHNSLSAEQALSIDKAGKPILFHYHSYRERDLYLINLIMKTIREKKQVLILIPDQFSCRRFREKLAKILGKSLVVFDKNASPSQKYLRFIAVQKEETKVVIGTRSNVFLPFLNLGLIIVEQEESALYKEERVPRYNAREVALTRGLLESVRVVLSSGAPSVESYWHGLNKKFLLKKRKNTLCPERKNYPETFLINLEEEKSFQKIISFQLQQQIVKYHKEERGIVLFFKRRGFASYISCTHCSQVLKCPNCNSLLSYHKETGKRGIQICNKCGKRIQHSRICPKCGNPSLKPMGFGIKYIEEMVRQMFPKATIQCFDRDIAPSLREQTQLVNRFKKGEIDILITTNFLFRRIDYRQVGLVGFILIDSLLNIPDYKSAEDTYQFINQIALHLLEQKTEKSLLIQTYLPDHHSLQAVRSSGYSLFYQKEIALRKELEYPPFTKIVKIDFIGANESQIRESIQHLKDNISGSHLKDSIGKDIFLNDIYPVTVPDKNRVIASLLIRIKTEKKECEELEDLLYAYILNAQKRQVRLLVDVGPIKLY